MFESRVGGVVAMGDRICGQLDAAVTALVTDDHTLAHNIVETDATVNDCCLEIERECLDLLARHQPVAGDLRFVVAAFTIVTDLERVGDHAVNVAARTLYALESSEEFLR